MSTTEESKKDCRVAALVNVILSNGVAHLCITTDGSLLQVPYHDCASIGPYHRFRSRAEYQQRCKDTQIPTLFVLRARNDDKRCHPFASIDGPGLVPTLYQRTTHELFDAYKANLDVSMLDTTGLTSHDLDVIAWAFAFAPFLVAYALADTGKELLNTLPFGAFKLPKSRTKTWKNHEITWGLTSHFPFRFSTRDC